MSKPAIRALALTGVLALSAIPGVAQNENAAEIGSSPSTEAIRGGDCAGGLVVDDNTAENGYSGNPASISDFVIVERLTPTAYPFQLQTVCIAYVSLGGATLDGNIRVYDDDGAAGGPGTLLGEMPFSIAGIPGGLPPAFYSFDVSALGIVIPDGNVYVGSQHNPMAFPSRFVGASENGGTGAGFVDFNNPTMWQAIGTVFPAYTAMLIRAEGIEVPVELQSFDID